MGLIGQPKRFRAGTTSHLENIAIPVIVMRYHVQDINPLDANLGQIVQLGIFKLYLQGFFHQPLTQVASAQTVRGEFFPGQVYQPDIAGQFSPATQFQKDRSAQHERRRGRMVVIRSGSRQARPGLSGSLRIMIFHVGGIVMIRHDHRPLSIPARNNDNKVALVRISFLIFQPAAGPRKIKVGFPLKREFACQGLILHLGGSDNLAIVRQQIVTQRFQVTVMVTEMSLRRGIANAIRVVFVEIFPLGQCRDGFPISHFK